jgi:hypothetical protein
MGATGVTGATGATGAAGAPVAFRNAWISSTIYAIGDAVSENGSSYIALFVNQGIDPAIDVANSGGTWAVLALKGADGVTGAAGPAGPIGATGLTGATGANGATGPVGPTGPQGLIGAQGNTGPTGPAGPSGSGLIVKDANGNALGTLVSPPGYYGGTLTIYKSGYAITVNVDGTFPPSQIWWSNAASCGGTAYLNDGNSGSGGVPSYYHTVVWSGAGDSLLYTSGTASKDLVTSVGAGTADRSIENYGTASGSYECDIHQNYSGASTNGYGGWALSAFDAQTTLGWPAFSTCTIVVQGGYDGSSSSGTPGANSTKTVSCLAGPLQLP